MKKTILRQILVPIVVIGLAGTVLITFLVSRYISIILSDDKFRIIELVVDRVESIVEFNNMSLQEYAIYNVKVSPELKEKVRAKTIDEIASFSENFEQNYIYIIVQEGDRTLFSSAPSVVSFPVDGSGDNMGTLESKTYLSHSTVFKEWDWVIYGLMDKQVFMKPILQVSLTVISMIMLVTLFVLSVVYLILRRQLYKPLYQLLDASDQIRGGHLSRINLSTTAIEFNNLIESFNNMLEALEKKREEEERLLVQLIRSEQLGTVGTFASSITHDFKNILTPIIACSSILMEDYGKDKNLQRSVALIRGSAEKGNKLAEQLLSFVRKKPDIYSSVILSKVIDDVLSLVESRFIKEGIQVKKEIDDALPYIHVNSAKLEQILLNLFINAKDSMGRGGVLTIAARPSSEEEMKRLLELPEKAITISVSDTGHGMDEKTMKHIFEAFFTTKPEDMGTGLGLAICRRIIQEHKGIIEVESVLGRGTTFRIIIPA